MIWLLILAKETSVWICGGITVICELGWQPPTGREQGLETLQLTLGREQLKSPSLDCLAKGDATMESC